MELQSGAVPRKIHLPFLLTLKSAGLPLASKSNRPPMPSSSITKIGLLTSSRSIGASGFGGIGPAGSPAVGGEFELEATIEDCAGCGGRAWVAEVSVIDSAACCG